MLFSKRLVLKPVKLEVSEVSNSIKSCTKCNNSTCNKQQMVKVEIRFLHSSSGFKRVPFTYEYTLSFKALQCHIDIVKPYYCTLMSVKQLTSVLCYLMYCIF